MSRTVCISLVLCCLAAGPAVAQVSPDANPAVTSPASVESPRLLVAETGPLFRAAEPARPPALLPMYASLVTLQALDFVSTTRALSSGAGYEANPVMRPVVGNSAAFLAVKASSTAATIWMVERLRRKHPARAVVVMLSTNAAMAAVVAHNFSVR